jgi:hypothetical protein
MRSFEYRRAADRTEALSFAGAERARYLGGGTNLVDLMRQNIEAPAALVDVSRLPGTIENTPNGGLLIGAALRNSVVAAHPSHARSCSSTAARRHHFFRLSRRGRFSAALFAVGGCEAFFASSRIHFLNLAILSRPSDRTG